jgi:hypothetical protein
VRFAAHCGLKVGHRALSVKHCLAHTMTGAGSNRRKMEAQRAAAAEKEAAAKRATQAQILEDAGRHRSVE